MGSPRKQAGTQQQEAHQQQQQQREKMCGPPCFRSVCGMPLQKAVYIIGLIELIITVIVTIANVVKYSQFVNERTARAKTSASAPSSSTVSSTPSSAFSAPFSCSSERE